MRAWFELDVVRARQGDLRAEAARNALARFARGRPAGSLRGRVASALLAVADACTQAAGRVSGEPMRRAGLHG